MDPRETDEMEIRDKLRRENDKHVQIKWGIAQINKKKKKKHKGNKNIQQVDKTFTFRILKLEISF